VRGFNFIKRYWSTATLFLFEGIPESELDENQCLLSQGKYSALFQYLVTMLKFLLLNEIRRECSLLPCQNT